MDKPTSVALFGGLHCAVCHFPLSVDATADVRPDGGWDTTRFTGLWDMQTSASEGCRSCCCLLNFFYDQIEAGEGFPDTEELGLIWGAYQPERACLGFSSRRDNPGMYIPKLPMFELITPGRFLSRTYHQNLSQFLPPFKEPVSERAC